MVIRTTPVRLVSIIAISMLGEIKVCIVKSKDEFTEVNCQAGPVTCEGSVWTRRIEYNRYAGETICISSDITE
jgi:hypothetical protein